MTPQIETFTGRYVAPLDPEWQTINIRDIAHALARQCRYSGQCRFHYSVAEHSVRVSEQVPKRDQLWALLHDATEAYLVDLPRPLKNDPAIGGPYRKAEAVLSLAVCKRFLLPATMPRSVHVADAVLLATEVRDLMHGDRAYWLKLTHDPIPAPYRIRPWGIDVAEHEFLRMYKELATHDCT